MKLLFDQKHLLPHCNKLIGHYTDCKHVSDVGLLNSEDPEIWEFAKKNVFTIVTFDSDYYEISLISGSPP